MKSFVETSKNIASLQEGLMDVVDAGAENIVNSDIIDTFFNDCVGNFTYVKFKDNSVRITGNPIISGFEGKELPIKVKELKGGVTIDNCPNLETLEGPFFANLFSVKGNVTINKCPKLVSLKGLPALIDKNLTISNCKSLKDIDVDDLAVFGTLTWINNGKKLTKEQIEKKVKSTKRIDCSAEEVEAIDESMVNEALSNPWLQKLSKQLKNNPYKVYVWGEDTKTMSLKDLLGEHNFNNITLKNTVTYDLWEPNELKDALKAVYFTVSSNKKSKFTANSLLLYNNEKDCFDILITSGKRYVLIPGGQGGRDFGIYERAGRECDVNASYINEIIRKAGNTYGKYTMVALLAKDWHEIKDLQFSRRNAREGMINPGDAEQYAKIARDNVQRYKNAVAKMKANKEREKYTAIDDKVEDIMNRVFKLTRDAKRNPGKYNKYDVERIVNKTSDHMSYDRGRSYGENGLLYCYNYFNKQFEDCFGKKSYGEASKSDFEYLDKYLQKLETVIEKCDSALKALGF